MDDRKAKKSEKRSRAEKEKVMDVLFSAFEKHQFYNVKDLVGITKQPVVSTLFLVTCVARRAKAESMVTETDEPELVKTLSHFSSGAQPWHN